MALLAVAAPAQAVVTTSNVTTPSDPFFTFYDNSSGDPQKFTVAGTTDGSGGELVDLRCYYDGTYTTLAENVPVEPDGTFSTADADKPNYLTCVIRAVPDAGYTNSLANYTGPRAGFGYTWDDPGVDHETVAATLSGGNDFYSLGDWGMCYSWLNDASFNPYNGNWSCVAGVKESTFHAPGSHIVVDGHNAYAPATADYEIGSPGGPELTVDRTFDPLTGQWKVVETNPLVFCYDGGIVDVEDADTVDCPEYVSSGVTVVRTITMDHDGQRVRFSDEWRSTDGASHDFDVFYMNWLSDDTTLWPGEATYSDHLEGTVLPLNSIPVGSAYTQTDEDDLPGIDNIQGAITWLTSPTRAIFEDGSYFVLQYDRTIPAGGSTNITQVYSEAFTREEVRSLAEGAEDEVVAPAVTIASPANGAVTSSDTVSVTGTASDNIGVHSLTVNGIPTTVGADGSWSQHVPLSPGANNITAVATDESGNTGQAQVSVTHTPAAGSCTVPNVVGQTQAAASAAITAAGCTVGELSLAPSRTVARGSVISQGNAAGQKVSSFFPVPLVISSGPVARASLVGKTLRLKGRRISMQVRCPATAGDVCNGTLKLRTSGRLGGAKRTLGTRSFQAPPGARRRTTLTVSKANARRIHRAGRVKALAFIVMRDEDGKARTTRTRITIRG